MNIDLPRQLAAFVEEEVSRGRYNSPGEVIAEAVRELQDRKQRQFETADFDRLIDEGKASSKRELGPAVWAEIWRQGAPPE